MKVTGRVGVQVGLAGVCQGSRPFTSFLWSFAPSPDLLFLPDFSCARSDSYSRPRLPRSPRPPRSSPFYLLA